MSSMSEASLSAFPKAELTNSRQLSFQASFDYEIPIGQLPKLLLATTAVAIRQRNSSDQLGWFHHWLSFDQPFRSGWNWRCVKTTFWKVSYFNNMLIPVHQPECLMTRLPLRCPGKMLLAKALLQSFHSDQSQLSPSCSPHDHAAMPEAVHGQSSPRGSSTHATCFKPPWSPWCWFNPPSWWNPHHPGLDNHGLSSLIRIGQSSLHHVAGSAMGSHGRHLRYMACYFRRETRTRSCIWNQHGKLWNHGMQESRL